MMKDNTILLIAAMITVGILTLGAMCLGNLELAGVGLGAEAGMLSGHLNGTQQSPPAASPPTS